VLTSDVSTRQIPCVNRLAVLLDDAKSIAYAINDNAHEELKPIPNATYEAFAVELFRIANQLERASQVQEASIKVGLTETFDGSPSCLP
tara:strand:- start:815 stop:1081 length:267 start_codon:yes stop_codon:yes gene_type:complete